MLTNEDRKKIAALNQKSGWGIDQTDLEELILAHKRAREAGDLYGMKFVEYRLEDCNFHLESRALDAGLYNLMLDNLGGNWDEFDRILKEALDS